MKLCEASRERGLKLNAHGADVLIKEINEYHDKSAAIRYKFAAGSQRLSCTILFPIAEEILSAS